MDVPRRSSVSHDLAVEALVSRYLHVRQLTEHLAQPLSAEDQQLQSMPSCSPTKWHRAHTTWFFEEFILSRVGVEVFDARYARLFNSYYESVGPRHPRHQRGLLSRPSAQQVGQYRRAVDERMVSWLEGLDAATLRELGPIVELGLAHEQQHQELLVTDILHAMWSHPERPAPYPEVAVKVEPRAEDAVEGGPQAQAGPGGMAQALRQVEHAEGVAWIGVQAQPGLMPYAFDHESPRHRVWLEPFAVGEGLVTWELLRAFIEEGGYQTPSLWLSEGLEAVRREGLRSPLYTEHEPGSLRVFTPQGMIEPDAQAPAAHLSYYEADALARWAGARLPTEAELEVWCAQVRPEQGSALEGWPTTTQAALRRADGRPAQLYGQVWTWTSSAFGPYPGYTPAPGALGEYNGKFMVNQQVLRGGSCWTPARHVRATSRNFWPAATQFQCTGARLAWSLRS